MSWTKNLRNLRISKLTKYTIDYQADEDSLDWFTIGSLAWDFLPGMTMDDSDTGAAFDRLIAVHDAYMSAACMSVSEFATPETIKPFSYYLGFVYADVAHERGVRETLQIPLLLSPSIEGVHSKKSEPDKPLRTWERSCSGLYFSGGMAVTLAPDSRKTIDTFRHELIHLMISTLPSLKESMYGSGEGDQREEIAAHIVTDHIDKLINVANLEFTNPRFEEMGCNKSSKKWLYTLRSCAVDDISFKGESLVKDEIYVKPHPITDEERADVVERIFYDSSPTHPWMADLRKIYTKRGGLKK